MDSLIVLYGHYTCASNPGRGCLLSMIYFWPLQISALLSPVTFTFVDVPFLYSQAVARYDILVCV